MFQCSPCSPGKTAPQANCIYRLTWLGDLTRIWATDSHFEPFEPSVWNSPLDTVTGPVLQPDGSLVSALLDYRYTSVQFSSVVQSCPTLCDPMNRSTPGLPVHHQLPEFTQTNVHRVSDAIQPSHPLLSPFLLPLIPPSIRVFSNESTLRYEVAKVLELQF